VARAIRTVRGHTGFGALDNTTQFIELTPADMPAGATLTRLIGTLSFFAAPDADNSAQRILFLTGFGVTDDPTLVNVSDPNDPAVGWLWWNEITLTMDGQWVDASTFKEVPTGRYVDFDVHGQRLTNQPAGLSLYLFARLFGDPLGGTQTSRISYVQLYKLPEA
jgi:hypothetical protein